MMDRPHVELLLRLHPAGPWSDDQALAPYQELKAWGDVLDAQDSQVDELLAEILPDTTSALLSRWEALYELHRESGLTEAQRRRRLAARRRHLPNARPETLRSILAQYSDLTITIVEPGAFRTDDPDSLTDTPSDVIDGAFVWWIEVDEVAARAGDTTRAELEHEVQRVNPAHLVAFVRCDDFCCDDPWSLCDRDLLGA